MPRRETSRLLDAILATEGSVSTSELATSAGVSRQAAHRLLRSRVDAGTLLVRGRARATRYHATAAAEQGAGAGDTEKLAPHVDAETPLFGACYRTAGLAEDAVWNAVEHGGALERASDTVIDILHYAVTELVNNAIDHASGTSVSVAISEIGDSYRLDVEDDGVGVFEHVRAHFDLPSPLFAVEQLHKGKTTTMPDRHSGEGLFFVSKAVDCFELQSDGLIWQVNAALGDMAIRRTVPGRGTSARCWLDRATQRRLRAVFDPWTDDLRFDRTRTVVHLFEHGVQFVSRSEAKRMLIGLERFQEVMIDFAGVQGIGQGFADEVFRVFARRHPEVRLVPRNMNDAVSFMVERVDHAAPKSD